MQILFLDESGTAPARNAVERNPYFVLGGLIVPEAQWKSLQKDLRRLKAEYHVDGEVKWRYFIPHPLSHKVTPLSHLDIPQLDELRMRLFNVIASYKSFRVLATVVDTKSYYEKHPDRDAEDMYHDAFGAVCARFQYYLQDMQRATTGSPFYGMVVIDERNNQQNKQLDNFHFDLLNNHDSRRADYNNLVEGLFIAASHHSVGVQFADLGRWSRLPQGIQRRFEFLRCDTRQYPVPPERRRERVWDNIGASRCIARLNMIDAVSRNSPQTCEVAQSRRNYNIAHYGSSLRLLFYLLYSMLFCSMDVSSRQSPSAR